MAKKTGERFCKYCGAPVPLQKAQGMVVTVCRNEHWLRLMMHWWRTGTRNPKYHWTKDGIKIAVKYNLPDDE